MKTLVTGGAGFIGSRLVGRLLAQGDDVWVVDDFSLGRRENLAQWGAEKRLRIAEMDCRSREFAAHVTDARPQRIFHLAANSDIPRGINDPTTDLERTFLTTFSTLEAMRHAGTRELVLASTSAIYGDCPGELGEDHGPLAPISLYGAAKLASEAYVSAYCHLFGMRCWAFRFPNVAGPNLTHGVIYDFARKLMHDRSRLVVLGDGTQTKPYLDVDDLLDAIFLAMERRPEPLATYNVAGEGMTSVREIAEMVRDAAAPGAAIEYGTGPRGWPGDVPTFKYDTTKITALGWRPTKTSAQAVAGAVAAEVERCRRSS